MDSEGTRPFRIALVQMDPALGDRVRNRAVILDRLADAAVRGAELVIFPECSLSGYVFADRESAAPAAETVPGETSEAVEQLCRERGVTAVVGLLERDGDTIYNSAFVVGPSGLVATYRKCHLPVLGVDRFVGSGHELPIITLPFARIGILICYDIRFPEAARSLALRGAEVIVVPTNWPIGAESAPDFLTRARAWENRVWVGACNRVGTEAGATFIGRSHVVSPDGVIVAEADGAAITTIVVEIDPIAARRKRLVIKPGEFELDPIGGRRPDLYGNLVTPRSGS